MPALLRPALLHFSGYFLRILLPVGVLMTGASCAHHPRPTLHERSQPRTDMHKASKPEFAWPDGKRAAITLSYDDAISSQRTSAVAHLAQFGLPATFFLTGTSADLKTNRDQWQALVSSGHELAAHTMHHPCDKKHDWVAKGYAIQDYDINRMEAELVENIQLLDELGALPPYTFAYPCGETELGEEPQSYRSLVKKYFAAARGVHSEIAAPTNSDLNLVPAIDGAKSQEQLISLVDRVENEGGWLVFFFHGVGGDYLSVELAAHEALLTILHERRDRIWTERFGKVAAYLKKD